MALLPSEILLNGFFGQKVVLKMYAGVCECVWCVCVCEYVCVCECECVCVKVCGMNVCVP